jgi:phosphoglycolate phosphatase
MIKLVAFDWNGTLLSDTMACVNAVNRSYSLLQIKPVSLSSYRKHFIVPIRDFWLALGASKEAIDKHGPEVNRLFHANYEKLVTRCRTRRGTREILPWLKQKGIPAVIFSNHTIAGVEAQLARLGIRHFFADVVANDATHVAVSERNKLLKLRHYLESKGIKGSEVVIVGDSCEEIEIGKTLGSITVAITNGNYSESRLKRAKPDFLISSLSELKWIIS